MRLLDSLHLLSPLSCNPLGLPLPPPLPQRTLAERRGGGGAEGVEEGAWEKGERMTSRAKQKVKVSMRWGRGKGMRGRRNENKEEEDEKQKEKGGGGGGRGERRTRK